jgi:hypothetical protein
MSEAVIIVTVKLKPDASRARFIELGRKVKTWLAAQPGFVSYDLFESDDGRWTDVMTFTSDETMEAVHVKLGESDITDGFDALIEPEHVSFIGKAVAL